MIVPSISQEDFLPKTWEGFSRCCAEAGIPGDVSTYDLAQWALLPYYFRQLEDRPGWFPSGKWATIQRIESLVEARTMLSVNA